MPVGGSRKGEKQTEGSKDGEHVGSLVHSFHFQDRETEAQSEVLGLVSDSLETELCVAAGVSLMSL